MTKDTKILLICVGLCVCLISGCGVFGKKNKRWKPVKPGKQAFVHTVKWQEESFEMIARWYTGNKDNAEVLINANPAVNAEKLTAGDLIYIPNRLLKNRKELQRNYVVNYNKKPVKKKKKKAAPKPKPVDKPKENEEFELFGPR